MRLSLGLIITLLTAVSALGQMSFGWKGIIPLTSSREDVLETLGTPKQSYEHSDLFFLPDVKVNVHYSSALCEGALSGWRVRKGTVLSILVVPLRGMQFDVSKLGKDFVKGSVNDDLSVEYTNVEKGIRFTESDTGTVNTVYYMPSKKDSKQRCLNKN